MPPFALIEDTVYAWMPIWFLVMMLVSSVGGALLFLLTIRVSGKKGFVLLAIAAALPSLLFIKGIAERKIEEAAFRYEHPGGFLVIQGGTGRPEVPWISALTFGGAILIYRSEKKAAIQLLRPTEQAKSSGGELGGER